MSIEPIAATTASIQPDRIPDELKALSQWCVWRLVSRNGKPTKVPFQPSGKPAKSNDPATWSAYDEALTAYQTGNYSGLGLFMAGDLTGIDLDHCIDASGATPAALEILSHFAGTYAEVSPSGTGYRVFCYGKPGRSGKGNGADKWIECYAAGSPRYLTVTGNVINHAAVTHQQPALDWLHTRYFDKPASGKPASNPPNRTRAVNIQAEPHDVYIGRPAGDSYRKIPLNNPYHGLWGNPFKEGKDGTRTEVIALFEDWLLHSPEADEQRRRLPELRGKRLGCHCKPADCHGDVLARLAEQASGKPNTSHCVHPHPDDAELINRASNASKGV